MMVVEPCLTLDEHKSIVNDVTRGACYCSLLLEWPVGRLSESYVT